MYNVFKTSDTTDDASIVPSVTAMSTGSTFATRGTSAPSEVAAAINQLAANQTAIWKQMTALQQPSVMAPSVAVPTQATPIAMTPVPSQFATPATATTFQQPFQAATQFGRTVPHIPGTNFSLPNPGGRQAGGRFTGRGRGRDSFRGRGRNVALNGQYLCQGDTRFPLALVLAQHVLLLTPHILTSPRSLTIGTHVIRVDLTFRTNIRPRLALCIGAGQRMMRGTRVKMHRLTSIRDTTAVPRTCIRRRSLSLGSPDR